MSKMICIKNEVVTVGNDDGSFLEVPLSELNFKPVVG